MEGSGNKTKTRWWRQAPTKRKIGRLSFPLIIIIMMIIITQKKAFVHVYIWMVSLFCFALYIAYILYRRSKQTNDHYHYVENKKKIMFLFIFTYFLSFSLTFFFIFTSHKLNILWIIRWNVIRNIWNMESLYRRKKCNKNDFLLCLNSFVNLT